MLLFWHSKILSIPSHKLSPLKVLQCRFEDLSICSSSHKNNVSKILHYNTFNFLRYAHMSYVNVCLQKENLLRISLLVKKYTNLSRKYRVIS